MHTECIRVSQYIAVTILHDNRQLLYYCGNFRCHDSRDCALKVVLQRLHALLLQKIVPVQPTHYNVESTSIVVCRSTMLVCAPA